jgi:hypothetical protein
MEQPMRMFRPLRTVRTPGWPARVAAGLATAGLIAGVVHAPPASAHLVNDHRVHINGYMSLLDIDDLGRDEVCDLRDLDEEKVIDPSIGRTVSFHIERDCSEIQGFIDISAEIRSDNYVQLSGTIRATETTCFLFFCGSPDIDKLPFATFMKENNYEHIGPKTISGSGGHVKFEFSVIVYR